MARKQCNFIFAITEFTPFWMHFRVLYNGYFEVNVFNVFGNNPCKRVLQICFFPHITAKPMCFSSMSMQISFSVTWAESQCRQFLIWSTWGACNILRSCIWELQTWSKIYLWCKSQASKTAICHKFIEISLSFCFLFLIFSFTFMWT